ncbi:MAG: GDCCVxC domain-containing (seleno)protein [Burkholderiales bacterium]
MTCPHCAFAKEEVMPTDACLFFYECNGCGGSQRNTFSEATSRSTFQRSVYLSDA